MIKTNSSSTNPCGNGTTSECVTWEGPDIECLGIEKGQTISVAMEILANEICELKESLDLSDLDLKCLFDICADCPDPVKTLRTVLELIINKICSIQETIDALNLSTSTGSDPILTLASCFQYTSAEGDLIVELPHTTYTKRIATKVCELVLNVSALQDDVADLQNTVSDLQTQINELDLNIPDVTSDCLFVGTKSIADAWELLDAAFCQLRTGVGTITEINLAISRQCSELNAEFGGEPGWVAVPENLADSLNNLWIAFCAVKAVQDTCCAVTCDDVLIGFNATYSEDNTEVILTFTSGAGTSLPNGFTDIGSTINITDIDGNVATFNTGGADVIELNAELEVNVTGLNLNGDLVITIDTNISNGTLTCSKCITKTIKKPNCAYCEICAEGEDGSYVVITYRLEGSSIVTNYEPTTTTTSTTTTTTAAP